MMFHRRKVFHHRLKVLHHRRGDRLGQKVLVGQTELEPVAHHHRGLHHLTESEVARVPPMPLHWLIHLPSWQMTQPMQTKRLRMRH